MLLFSECMESSNCKACVQATPAECTTCDDGRFLDTDNSNVCASKL